MPAMLAILRRYWPVLVATAVLVPHALLFDFVNDDAYISFRYAQNLAQHGELVFNLGERVEGYTNFLWTVLLAGGILVGASPVMVSRFLGVMFGVATLAVAVRLSLRVSGERPSRWHLVAPVGLAATGAFACWCTGGLETQLFTFLVFLGFERLLAELEEREGFASAACFALAAMTRPEGVLLFAVAALFRVISNFHRYRRIKPRQHELLWLLLFVLIFGPYFLWRGLYYGWLFPNTFYVKSSASGFATWQLGLYYLRRFAEDYGLALLAPIAVLGWPARGDRRRRNLFAVTALVWAVFALYVVQVGGDFMGLYRFILPVLPLGAVVLQEALRGLFDRLAPLVGWPVLGVAGVALASGFLLGSAKVSRTAATVVAAENGIDTPAYLKQYALDRIPVGIWFRRHARPDDLMTVGGAGVIPYYAGIPAFDVFGLVDENIAHDPTMTVSNRPGHQKWGSDPYMLSRRPTLITHKYCLGGPCPEESWAYPGYRWERIQFPGLRPGYYSFMRRIPQPH
jgi:arabinofuranosyltransferase